MNAIVGALKERGVLPFVNFNRIHVVPALNIDHELAREGIAAIDEALTATG
jgi:taurine--2-oxoglutarate transaminase